MIGFRKYPTRSITPDVNLIEKVIRAFSLVELLATSKLPNNFMTSADYSI